MPALAAADTNISTGSTSAPPAIQLVCPLAADITRPWTHDVFPGCASPAYELHVNVPDDQPCQVDVHASRVETTYHQYDDHGHWLESSGEGLAAKCFRKDGKLRSCDQGDDQARFTYDKAGRIIEVSLGKATTTYGYDERGDLTTIHGAGGDTELAYDNHRLVTERTNKLVTRYRYDDDGRVVSRSDGMTLSYDDRGRLARINEDNATTTIAYDGNGRVASETVSSTVWGSRVDRRAELRYCSR